MSKSHSIAFFEEISKNKQLAQEVEKVVGGKNSDEAKAKELISLAKEHGFNFTQKEAASAQGELKKSLSPEELLEVSGGKGGFKSSLMAMALLAGLGVGGAAMSSMEASAMDGDNHQEIQVPGGQAEAGRQEGNAQPGQQQQGADGIHEQPEQQQQGAEGNHEQPGQQQQGAEGHQEQPGQQNAPAQAEQQQQWVFDGWHTVDAGHYIGVQGPGGLLVTGDSGRVEVASDREVHVNGPGQRGVFVHGDREVHVTGPGQQTVHIHGDRPTTVFGGGKTDVLGSGLSLVMGSGGVEIARPGGRTVGELPEIFVAPPVLQNPDRGPQEAPVYAPRNVFLNEVGTAIITGAQQAYINCPCDVTHSAPGGNLRVTGNTMITTEGINHITAGEDSHITSFSQHEVEHQGMGGVRIDPFGDSADILIGAAAGDGVVGRDVTIENANAVAVNGAVSLAVTAVGNGGINISSDATVTHSADRGQINVTGGAVINADGPNRINAYEGTTIASTSANLLTHDGDGGVVIDGGSIEVSGSSLEQVERDVTVNMANSVTVAMANSVTVSSGTTMRTQNGTEFTMGATREETIDLAIEEDNFNRESERAANGLEQIFNSNTTEAQETPVHRSNLHFNNPRLKNVLVWAMERFGLTGQDLVDFVQNFL